MKPLRASPLARLVDANPMWLVEHGKDADGVTDPDGPVVRNGLGVGFTCPIHERCFVFVRFTNPLDGKPAHPGGVTWERSGDTFETLTLSPSIRILGGADGCEWHGYIRGGAFEHCGDSR